MTHRAKKALSISLVLANLFVILYFWRQASGPLLFQGTGSMFISIGRIAGLLMVFLILLQVLMMGRARFLESVWGLDKLSRIHHWNGVLTLVFLFAHPFFIASGYARAEDVGLIDQYFSFLRYYDDIAGAFFAILIFLLVIISSIIIIKKKWNFELFYFIHLSVYLAILLAFGHQLELGGDFAGSILFTVYWWLIYILVFGFLIIYRFLLPLYNLYRFRFIIKEVKKENDNVVSIKITGKNIDNFKIQPGQFMIFRFFAPSLWWQAHPFSLSGRGPGYIRLSVKAVGDYTRAIQSIKPGIKVLIEGPYGIFTSRLAKKDKFLLIAGGIGITPIISLAQELSAKNKDIALLYGNRRERDIVFLDELSALAGSSRMGTKHVLSREKNESYEHGFIDDEKIKRLVPDFMDREIYVCGPPVMMLPLVQKLKILGIKTANLHYERFSL
jgi:predicted ferric reductase